MKASSELVTWAGKEVSKMTRDELELALRICASLYQNLIEEQLKASRTAASEFMQ